MAGFKVIGASGRGAVIADNKEFACAHTDRLIFSFGISNLVLLICDFQFGRLSPSAHFFDF